MKSKFLSFLLGPLFSLSPLFAQNFDPLGEEENQYLPRMIRVQMEFIEIPHTEYTKIMKKPRKTANDDDLRSACDALIESGKGKVLESTCVIAKPGLKATSGSILEYIYPTEYEPAMGAETVTDKDGKQTAVHGTNAPTPTTFDTKNLGLSFEKCLHSTSCGSAQGRHYLRDNSKWSPHFLQKQTKENSTQIVRS